MKYVIIGNGTAGINAAITIRKRDKKSSIQVISRETEYFFSRTALMYIAMNDMRLQDTEPYERHYYKKNKIELIHKNAVSIDSSSKLVKLDTDEVVQYDKLLLATGSVPAMFGWPGQNLDGVVNFVSYQDLEKIMKTKKKVKNAVIVGGGLIGIELAEVYFHWGAKVTFLIRENTFWPRALSSEEGILVQKHMNEHGINVIMDTNLKSINGDNGKVSSIKTDQDQTIPADVVGICTGVKPCVDLAKNSNIPVNRGILVDNYLQTQVEDIYAAGDCAEREGEPDPNTYPKVISIWYTSRDMGRVAGSNMLGDQKDYAMGQWYNSAKFFELEYTSVGRYLPVEDKDENYYIESSSHSASIRIVHQDGVILGYSMIGSRWDHEILLKFINERRTLDYFFQNYNEARFDPEFVTLPDFKFMR